MSNDAIVKRNTRLAVTKFVHFKTASTFVRDVQPLAVAFRRQENVVIAIRVDGLREPGFEPNSCGAVGKLAGAKIFKPIFRRLH